MDDGLRYSLSEAQHERIFQNDIRPVYLRTGNPLPSAPAAIILGGQPGSGKSGLLVAADKQLRQDGRTVVINGDDLRSFHPAYGRLQTEDPTNAARHTDRDSGRWVEKLINAVAAERVNMVIESTMRRPEVFRGTARGLLAKGYHVEAHALAVPEPLSWQGVHLRYERMLSQGNAARFTVREAHDAGAAGMLNTLRAIEQDRLAHRVQISTRDKRVLYDNRLVDDTWQQPPNAAGVVVVERRRMRNPEEQREVAATWKTIIGLMTERAAGPPAIHQVRRTAQADARRSSEAQTANLDLAARPPTLFAARLRTWRESRQAEKANLAGPQKPDKKAKQEDRPAPRTSRSSDPSP